MMDLLTMQRKKINSINKIMSLLIQHVIIVFKSVFSELEHLLEEEISIEGYFDWLNALVHHCIIKVGNKSQFKKSKTDTDKQYFYQYNDNPIYGHFFSLAVNN